MVRISVVLPVFNEAKWMQKTLISLQEQTQPYDELIIVDNESYDESYRIALQYTNKVFTAIRGKLNALQVGVSMSSGDIIFTTDADVWYPPDYIERMIKHFNDPSVVLVLGNVCFDSVIDQLWRTLTFTIAKNGMAATRAFQRQAFLQIGGFNLSVDQQKRLSIAFEEETLFHLRLSRIGKVIYDPTIIAYPTVNRISCIVCQHSEDEICDYCSEIQRGERF